MIDGILNIYKESGYTSHDVVAKLRGILGQKRIGHTGTLDPEAQGVLPVCLGKATKVCDRITDRDKTYRAVLLLGTTTDTQDITGQVLAHRPVTCTEAEARACIQGFVGEQEQIPPMYSALKVGGKKLCDLARQGIEVERKARRITIYDITVEEVALPELTLTVSCSKGTYIRSLCHDIGQTLGCGGCMKELLRTKAGPFLLEDSVKLSVVEQYRDEGRLGELVQRTDSVFSEFPALILTAEAERLVRNGNALTPELLARCAVQPPETERLVRNGNTLAPELPARSAVQPPEAGDGGVAGEGNWLGQFRVYGADRTFLALYEWNAQKRCLCAKTMFL